MNKRVRWIRGSIGRIHSLSVPPNEIGFNWSMREYGAPNDPISMYTRPPSHRAIAAVLQLQESP
ncbi:MAG: hypothetical protein ACI87A_001056 [Planctomycetota bacterium]|jgi:hypothetical protein